MSLPYVIGFGHRFLGVTQPPCVVAEISGNHQGSRPQAFALIAAAQQAGADAVKFQCYEPDDLVAQDTLIRSGPWAGQTLRALYEQAHTPPAWMPELFACAADVGIPAFASVYHPRHLPLLVQCGSIAYKIASAECTDLELIRACARPQKPVLISTGMATDAEVMAAATAAGRYAITLHCVAGYPTPLGAANLRRIGDMPTDVRGWSDHTAPPEAPLVAALAVACGAHVLERHLMLADTDPLDETFSSTPQQFAAYVAAVRAAARALHGPAPEAEEAMRALRRTLVFATACRAGDSLRPEDCRTARGGQGIDASALADVVGRTVLRDVQVGHGITWDALD